jgi:penicillin-binding protein 1A
VAKTAYRLGIASKLDANPSLALGTSEVSLLELTCAYAPFANGGNAITPHVVERVRTRAGKILYARASQPLGRIIEPRYVAMMNAMMRETLVSGTAQKAQFPGWPAAGKTGTSQDFRDAWFIGYTGHLVTGVWVGNDDSSPTKKATGGSIPVDVWSQFMRAAHQGVAVASLPGLAGNASFASALPNAAPNPTSEGQAGAQAGSQAVRPQPIDRGLDGWFLDRLFGRR